jgi:hypothetical protein
MRPFVNNHLIFPAPHLPMPDSYLCDSAGTRIIYNGGIYIQKLYAQANDNAQEAIYLARGGMLIRVHNPTLTPLVDYHAKRAYVRSGQLMAIEGKRYHTVSGLPLVHTGKLDIEGNHLLRGVAPRYKEEVFAYTREGVINPAYCVRLRIVNYHISYLDIATPRD